MYEGVISVILTIEFSLFMHFTKEYSIYHQHVKQYILRYLYNLLETVIRGDNFTQVLYASHFV